MLAIKRRLIGAAGALAFGLLAAGVLALRSGTTTPEPSFAIADALAALQPGDVVFIGSDDALWGRIGALVTGDRHVFAHVGMAARRDEELVIVHAGGSPTNPDAEVAAEPAADFLARAERVGVYRPALPDADQAAARGLAYADGGARFDGAFSLETEDRLYCTELVWRALSQTAGHDVAPDKSQWGDVTYIAIEDLRAAEILSPVAQFGDIPVDERL